MSSIIGFSGKIGSGKSTLAKALAHQMNWKYGSFSELLKKKAAERELEINRSTLQELGQTWINEDIEGFGFAFLDCANWGYNEWLVVDSIRHIEMIEVLKRITKVNWFILIYTEVETGIRNNRIASRENEIANHINEKHPVEVQSHRVLRSAADIVVDTSLSRKRCIEHILEWMKKRDHLSA